MEQQTVSFKAEIALLIRTLAQMWKIGGGVEAAQRYASWIVLISYVLHNTAA
tara:strand:- start:32 stop:187 length:156 start_codon:yes stop_codon:yes gene_type:complete